MRDGRSDGVLPTDLFAGEGSGSEDEPIDEPDMAADAVSTADAEPLMSEDTMDEDKDDIGTGSLDDEHLDDRDDVALRP